MATLLSINNYYYYRGGAETVFLEHNRMFSEGGWQVPVFAMRHPSNLSTPWERYFVDEIELGASYGGWERITRVPKVIYSFEARRKLASLIDDTRPDVCHAHNIYHHISPSILGLLKTRSVPIVITLHDLKIACPAYTMLASDGICERCRGGVHHVLLNRCVKNSVTLSGIAMTEALLHRLLGSYRDCVDRFIVPSRFYIKKLVEWGWPRSRFVHVPNFIEPSRYEPAYTPGDYFLYFGRLSREKGLATLIRAAGATGVRVVIAGTGPQLEELQQLTRQLRANVEFAGYLQGAALHQLIRGARAVVLPSEWYENAPMSVLEAYALGKPVVGASIGGIPELICDGQTGYGYRSGDAADLAGCLDRLTACPVTQIEAMGRRGREWVASEFTAAHYYGRIVSVYRELDVPVPVHAPALTAG